MPAFLLSPLFKIGAIVLAALAMWGYIAWLKHDAAEGWAAAEQHKANYATLEGAHKATLASVQELLAANARADAARAAVATKLKVSETRLSVARKAVENAKPAACAFPDTLRAVLDGLRKQPAAPSGDASPNDQAPASGRIAVLPR